MQLEDDDDTPLKSSSTAVAAAATTAATGGGGGGAAAVQDDGNSEVKKLLEIAQVPLPPFTGNFKSIYCRTTAMAPPRCMLGVQCPT